MTVAGDSILTILQIAGQEVHRLYLHPNLLAGPFVFDGTTYRVLERRVEQRTIPQRVTEVVEMGPYSSGETEPRLAYSVKDGPGWVAVLDLEPITVLLPMGDTRWPTDEEQPATCPSCGISWESTDLRRHPTKPLPWWRCSDCGHEWNEIERKAVSDA